MPPSIRTSFERHSSALIECPVIIYARRNKTLPASKKKKKEKYGRDGERLDQWSGQEDGKPR